MSNPDYPIREAQKTVCRENRDAVLEAIRDLDRSYVSARHLRKHADLDISPTLIGHTLAVLSQEDGPLEVWNPNATGGPAVYRVTGEIDDE